VREARASRAISTARQSLGEQGAFVAPRNGAQCARSLKLADSAARGHDGSNYVTPNVDRAVLFRELVQPRYEHLACEGKQ